MFSSSRTVYKPHTIARSPGLPRHVVSCSGTMKGCIIRCQEAGLGRFGLSHPDWSLLPSLAAGDSYMRTKKGDFLFLCHSAPT